nr:bifunctional diguanylate cyclase/phosphodiesterase [Pseudoalteromonas luteoviolacea]
MDPIKSMLDDILSNDAVYPMFQPIFDLAKEKILGFEALSRGSLDNDLVQPDKMFAAASKYDRLSELELLCRKKAIEQFARLNLPGKLFLNVSPKALLDPHHPKGETLHLIEEAGLNCNRVVIEVTEQDKVDDGFLLLKTISHYRQLGFKIAIDDLGAGYSGLKQWSELCPDFVKVDRYFIDYCDQSIVKREFLKSIIDLAKATNTAVIAEGIEREEELRLLKKLGIVNAQGFLLAKPSCQPNNVINNIHDKPTQLSQATSPTSQFEQSMAIGWLAMDVTAIHTNTQCLDAHRRFEQNKQLMSIAVLNDNRQPVGLLHRDQLTEVFASPYGHALFDKKSVVKLMDKQPLIVDEQQKLDYVSQMITENEFDIRRHIVITKEGEYLGLAPLRDILKHITEEKIRHAQHANPLTMLPGNVAINEAIEQRLKAKHEFSLGYIDLNHFKQFNDLYGYASGDSVIKLLADVTLEVCKQSQCFVGHIGGDDFMVVFDGADAESLCHQIIELFEARSKSLFTPEHVAAGGYWATNREGQKQFVPLLTLSIGLVSPDVHSCHNSHQVAALATDAKKEAKRYRNSYLFVCNRRKPSAPMVRLEAAANLP